MAKTKPAASPKEDKTATPARGSRGAAGGVTKPEG
ncbi:unnamed protein product, partial [Clonostachys rosea]